MGIIEILFSLAGVMYFGAFGLDVVGWKRMINMLTTTTTSNSSAVVVPVVFVETEINTTTDVEKPN